MTKKSSQSVASRKANRTGTNALNVDDVRASGNIWIEAEGRIGRIDWTTTDYQDVLFTGVNFPDGTNICKGLKRDDHCLIALAARDSDAERSLINAIFGTAIGAKVMVKDPAEGRQRDAEAQAAANPQMELAMIEAIARDIVAGGAVANAISERFAPPKGEGQ